MNSRMLLATSLLLIPGALAAAPSQNAGCPIYVLERSTEGFEVRTEIIPDEGSRAFLFGPGSRFVDVLLPLSAGTAGSIVQASRPHATLIRCRGGVIESTVQRQGEEGRQQPAVTVAELGKYRLRVSVIGADDTRAVFLIEPGGIVSRDTLGPVVDMFKGMVPLHEGDVSITTEVRIAESPTALRGQASLTWGGPWLLARIRVPGGGEGDVIVDLGASGTVLSRDILPPDMVVHPLVAVEHGPGGKRELAGTVGAAGGIVEGVGRAALPGLEVGGILVEDIVVNVLPDFPDLAGLPLVGVVGTDLFRRASVVRLEAGSHGGQLVLGDITTEGAAIEAPFSLIGGLVLLHAAIADQPIFLVLDTGARATLLTKEAAYAAGLQRTPGPLEVFRGLDGEPFEAWPAIVPHLKLGNGSLEEFLVHVGSLPVLKEMSFDSMSGLLGQDIWKAFNAIEVDWEREVVRFYRSSGPTPPRPASHTGHAR
jgi:hypothetical protein